MFNIGLIWLLVVAITSASVILCIKYLNLSQKWIFLGIIIILELFTLYSYYISFNYINTGIGYSVIKSISIILVIIGSYILFHEHLTVINFVGIIVIIFGIILVSL